MCAAPQFNTPVSRATIDDLVLIGGGSTASTILIRLRDEIRAANRPIPLRLHCFDEKGFPNGGIAYGQCSPHHILNSVRTEMSPWRTDAFHEYCLGTGIGGCKNDFNPRSDYAAFLRKETAQAISDLERLGATFIQHRTDVRIKKNGPWFDIVDSKSQEILLDNCAGKQIIIAAGYGPNKHFEELKQSGSPHYLHSIYECGGDLLHDHPVKQKTAPHIVFIGSGPALYDFVNDLHGNNLTKARLTVLSGASNRSLNVRDVAIEETEKNIVPTRLLALDRYASCTELRRAVIADFNRAAASPRRAALDILKNIKTILAPLSPDEAIAFQQSPFIGWLKHTATPVPLASHQRLQAFNPKIVHHRFDEHSLSFQHNHASIQLPGRILHADLVVNGTGHGRHNAPIIEQMKRDNLADVYAGYDALRTDQSGYRLSGSNIACIGPATHVGCDGVESFDIYAQSFVKDYVDYRKPRHSAEVLTLPHP